MNRRLAQVACLCTLIATAARADERVVLPLSLWDRVQAALQPTVPTGPEERWCALERTLEGRLVDGVLAGTLDVRFEVLHTEGWLDVPLLDSAASLTSVRVDGAPASLRAEGDHYVLGVARPGVHHVQIRFLRGADEDERAVEVELPEAGPTHVSILVPAVGIDATLASGVVTARRAEGGGTRLVGEANGPVRLSWRAADETAEVPLRARARQATLLTLDASLVTGRTQVTLTVDEGETDRAELAVPDGVEVVEVAGDDVLQWRVEAVPDAPDRLVVLLGRLVRDDVDLVVGFQYAVAGPQVALRLPAPTVATTGSIGVQAVTGLELTAEGAEPLAPGEVPGELAGMSSHPLHFAFAQAVAAQVKLGVRPNASVPLTSTIVDDLEATTMVLEDGTEIAKVRLFMRNNTRQYLGLELPAGATLTHALLDGHPLHPAVEGGEGRERLLIPLRQSSQAGERYHLVQPGENLGAIAYIHYSNPQKWPLIVDANGQLAGPEDVRPGQRLRIPPQPGVEVEESRFVFEFAWRRQGERLGAWGTERLRLPALDVDVVKATWHVYLPQAVVPLRFGGNLTAYSALRYDPFRRFGMFLRQALVADAEAATAADLRAALHQAEATAAADARVGLGAFPLVGTRYRFKRLLLGAETAEVTIQYLGCTWSDAAGRGALLLGLLLALLVLRPGTGLKSGALGLLLLVPALVAGHAITGVHRHLVWGFDLGLLLLLARHRGAPALQAIRAWLRAPRLPTERLTIRTALTWLGLLAIVRVIATYPLLASLTALVVLTLTWIRARQRPELRHG
ncbi:MAG: hypothetical protein H6706_19015 [Myxococcales bacterium]|nr:hypothetical protein [Myxococcales bacterium]